MVFSMYVPRNRIVGSYGSSTFSFLSNLYIVLHSGCTMNLLFLNQEKSSNTTLESEFYIYIYEEEDDFSPLAFSTIPRTQEGFGISAITIIVVTVGYPEKPLWWREVILKQNMGQGRGPDNRLAVDYSIFLPGRFGN